MILFFIQSEVIRGIIKGSDINFWLAIISILATIIALLQTFRVSKITYKRNREAGLYERPKLNIQIGQKYFPGNKLYIYYPFGSYNCLFYPLHIYILNTGSLPALNVELTINGSSDLLHSSTPSVTMNKSFSELKFKLLEETEYKKTIGISLNRVHPNSAIDFDYTVPLQSTEVDIKHIGVSDDNKAIELNLLAKFVYVLDLWLRSDNNTPIARRLEIRVIDTTHKPIDKILKEEADEKYREYKQNPRVSFFRFTYDLIRFKVYKHLQQVENIRFITFSEVRDHPKHKTIGEVIETRSVNALLGNRGFIYMPSMKIIYRPSIIELKVKFISVFVSISNFFRSNLNYIQYLMNLPGRFVKKYIAYKNQSTDDQEQQEDLTKK